MTHKESLLKLVSETLPLTAAWGLQYLEVTGKEIMRTAVTEHSMPFSILDIKKSTT